MGTTCGNGANLQEKGMIMIIIRDQSTSNKSLTVKNTFTALNIHNATNEEVQNVEPTMGWSF